MKRVAIFGSTGCVGQKVLDVIGGFQHEFDVVSLSGHLNRDLLEKQGRAFGVDDLILTSEGRSIDEVAQDPSIDIFVFAMEGMSGIEAAFKAAENSKTLLIANKEILVCGGKLFIDHCRKFSAKIFSIDHEIGAIDQCLKGEDKSKVKKITLTASGGPFLKRENFEDISFEEASRHPKHNCGQKVAVNSSTMMNKTFEMISCKHLFGINEIDVVIHPQCVVQSYVQFVDGTIKTICSDGDLSSVIAYALFEGERKVLKSDFEFDQTLEFISKEEVGFPCLDLGFRAIRESGLFSVYLNGACEELVDRFCQGELSWKSIGLVLKELMNKQFQEITSLEEIFETDIKARKDVKEVLEKVGV